MWTGAGLVVFVKFDHLIILHEFTVFLEIIPISVFALNFFNTAAFPPGDLQIIIGGFSKLGD